MDKRNLDEELHTFKIAASCFIEKNQKIEKPSALVINGFIPAIDITTYTNRINQDLDNLKQCLVNKGVIVHADTKSPDAVFELFENGIGYLYKCVSCCHGVIRIGESIDAIANSIAEKFQHFSFYKSEDISYTELVSGAKVHAYRLIFAAC